MASETDRFADPSWNVTITPSLRPVGVPSGISCAVASGTRRDCLRFVAEFCSPAVDRSAPECLPARTLSLSEIGCKIPQPIPADHHVRDARQIEYPQPVRGQGATPWQGDRLQMPAALKEIGRSVYF